MRIVSTGGQVFAPARAHQMCAMESSLQNNPAHIRTFHGAASALLAAVFFSLLNNGTWADDHISGSLKGRWIALIIEYTNADHPQQYLEGALQEASRRGVYLEIMDAKSDRQEMVRMLDDAVLRGADGIMLSHGSADTLVPGIRRGLEQGIPVVAFDCEIPLPGVTKIDQDDKLMAEIGLNRILEATGGKAKLVLIWVGGYAPMDKRMDVYSRFMAQHPGIKEVARFGNATTDTAMYTEITMKSLLEQFPAGTIDVVWAPWDEFARGAARAIKNAGRNEIKVYGMDVSNEDLESIQEYGGPWVETVAVDPKDIARTQINLLISAMNGGKIPERHSIRPRLITKSMLAQGSAIKMGDLHLHVPGWGEKHDNHWDSNEVHGK